MLGAVACLKLSGAQEGLRVWWSEAEDSDLGTGSLWPCETGLEASKEGGALWCPTHPGQGQR